MPSHSQLAQLWTLSLRRYMGRPSLRRCMGAVQLASSLPPHRASGQEHGVEGEEKDVGWLRAGRTLILMGKVPPNLAATCRD